jgi:hypothetical protein
VFARYTASMAPGLDHMLVDRSCYGGGYGARIGVITAPREGMNALHFTLVSLLASDAVDFAGVRVFSDSAAAPPCSVPVETEDAEELARRREAGGIYGTLNLARALTWAAVASDVAVVLEDDVMCSREWFRRGRALLEAAERERGETVISLHDMHGRGALGAAVVSVGTDVLLEGTADTYPHGSQGYLMRPATARRLAEQLQEKMALFWHHHFATAYSKLAGTYGATEGARIDGRGPRDLRPLSSEVGVLPTAHGTGLFQRAAASTIRANCRSFFSPRPTLPGLMRYLDRACAMSG